MNKNNSVSSKTIETDHSKKQQGNGFRNVFPVQYLVYSIQFPM